MNVLICSMQLVTPIVAIVALMILMGQDSELQNIVKNYVTIGFILHIDNMFADNFPL